MAVPRPFRVGLLVSALAVTSCGSDAPAGDEQPTSVQDSEEATDLDAIAAAFVGEKNGGVDALVRRDGRIDRVTAGVADANESPVSEGQAFRVGSISKPFVATMVLQLVEEGHVDLDERLSTYLATPIGSAATIRQLLSHRSGIPNYTDQPAFFAAVLADRDRLYGPADILEFVDESEAGPEEEFAYSNTNYILLGNLIEHVDETDLNASLENRITDRLGLSHTYFAGSSRPADDELASGWSAGVVSGDPSEPYESIASSAWAAGALVSTTDDLLTFLDALIGNELVAASSLSEMSNVGDAGYGLGLLSAVLTPGEVAVAHSGSIPGYSATMAIEPATGDALVIATNNDRLIADQLAAEIVAATL